MESVSRQGSAPVEGVSAASPQAQVSALELVATLVRFTLGVVFIYMGLRKVMHPIEFLKLVKQYELITAPPWLNLIAGILPWFEVCCGLLLVLGVAVRGVSLNLLLMLVPFTIVILRRALHMSQAAGLPFTSVKFDCGCGGGEVVIWQKLLENLGLVCLAAWLLTRKQGRFCV